MLMREKIKSVIADNLKIKRILLNDEQLMQTIEEVVKLCVVAFQSKRKVLFCGNGGSAADAQHLAAELSGRFYKDRAPLFAEALHVNSSFLTAVANDHSFEEVFSRMVQAKGQAGDVLIAISTSGNSPNIVRALETAKILNLQTVGFSGESGGKMAGLCDYLIKVPSINTPRIQEAHILIGHIVCELVEESLFG